MNNNNQHVLDDDRIGRLLLKLSLPAFFGMFVITLYNVIDTIFIGYYVGTLGIAGLSIVFPIQMLSLGIGQMIGMGSASLVSRLIGAGDNPRAERVLGNGIILALLLSIIMLVTGLIDTDFWLRLIGASDTVLPYARDYMTIILVSLVVQTCVMTLSSIVRAEGNARVSMTGMILGAVSNIILDAIFIIPLDMGIKGAAIATLIAQIISVIYLVFYYYSGKSYLKIHSNNLTLEIQIVKEIFAIGIASLSRMLAASLSAIIANRAIVILGGDTAISAFGIVNRILMFAIMPGIVIGQGLQPILGFNFGAKRYDRALKVITIATVAATVCSVTVFSFLFFFPEPFVRIFTSDRELIVQSVYAAKRIYLALYLVGFMMVGSLVFQSIGKAMESFITSISRPALFLIPLILILPRFWNIDGVWLAFPIADSLAFALTLILLIPQIRELRSNRDIKQQSFVEKSRQHG